MHVCTREATPPRGPALPTVVYEREPGAASRPLPKSYRRREPEKTALYEVIRDHLESFLEDGRRRSPTGEGYPRFIEHEFRRYLSCGLLSGGFSRWRCASCGHERLVALSCKGRLCPSCWSRRAANLASDLVDRVLPRARYRSYVVTFPRELRYPLATDRAFFSLVLRTVLRTLFAWQRLRGRRRGLHGGQTGAVTFIHRFTQSLSLFPHIHSVVPDGLFVPSDDPKGELRFVSLPAPSDHDIASLTRRIAERLAAVARRHLEQLEQGDDDGDEQQQLARWCVAEAMRNPAGPTRSVPATAAPPKPLTARVAGMSLHAARTIEPNDRAGLEQICSYGLRPPLATERFSHSDDGRVRYELRKPLGPAGRTELVLEPLALLRRLAAILPQPRTHLVRYHGVFANRSRYRHRLPRAPTNASAEPAPLAEAEASGLDAPAAEAPAPTPDRPRRRRLSWTQLLRRSLGIEASTCPHCAAPMVLLAFITEPRVVARILRHLGLPDTPPPLAPARDPYDDFEATDLPHATVVPLDQQPHANSARRPGQGRAPPTSHP